MKVLELTSEELEVLRDIVRRNVGEMEIEISHTHSRDFREMLRQRRQRLEQVLQKLMAQPVMA